MELTPIEIVKIIKEYLGDVRAYDGEQIRYFIKHISDLLKEMEEIEFNRIESICTHCGLKIIFGNDSNCWTHLSPYEEQNLGERCRLYAIPESVDLKKIFTVKKIPDKPLPDDVAKAIRDGQERLERQRYYEEELLKKRQPTKE